jgi:hypothetical protein
MKPGWFVATIILKSEIEGELVPPSEWICLQEIYVVRAQSREIAYEKALNLGKSREVSYLNSDDQLVSWTFVGLENLEELSTKTIRDGTEVWGRVFHTADPTALVVDQEGLSVYFNEEIRDLTAAEILQDGPGTKLVCNRIPT